MKNTIDVGLTRDEIFQLSKWHHECETRCAEMREYHLANEHKDRTYLFDGLQKTGAFLNLR